MCVLTGAGDLSSNDAGAVGFAGYATGVVCRYVDGAPRFRDLNTPTAGTSGGIPWVVTAPLANPLPTTGTIDYEVLAATKPVFSSGNGGEGMFDANLTIGFGASGYGYGIDGSILMPEGSGDVR